MFRIRMTLVLLGALLVAAGPAGAYVITLDSFDSPLPIGGVLEGGGGPQSTYLLPTGELAALWGFVGVFDDWSLVEAQFDQAFNRQINGYYYGSARLEGGEEYAPIDFALDFGFEDVDRPEDGRIFNAFWTVWDGGDLVLRHANGTSTASGTAGNDFGGENPFEQPIPEPGTIALFGLGAGAWMLRRKMRSS